MDKSFKAKTQNQMQQGKKTLDESQSLKKITHTVNPIRVLNIDLCYSLLLGKKGPKERKQITWKYLLKIEKNRYPIFVLLLQFGITIKHSFTIVWGENTITTKRQKRNVNKVGNKRQKKLYHKQSAYI